MELITLKRAEELSGIAASSLRVQAQRGRLQVVKKGRDNFTTRAWLHAYLMGREKHQGPRKPLPPDYQAPE